MNKTVFISSTYVDLIEHRKVVWDLLENFNVRITGMEKFGARKENSLDTCLMEVENSDVYLAIIGMRYGSVDDVTGKSYTHLEYDKAYSLSREVLVYLIDQENASVPIKNIDFNNHNKLIEFKSLLKSRHTVAFFTDASSLEKEIKRDFQDMLDKINVSDFIKLAKISQKFDKKSDLYIKEKYRLEEVPSIQNLGMMMEGVMFGMDFSAWYKGELRKYDMKTLRRILAIMYIGRGDDIPLDIAYKDLESWGKEKIISQLAGKKPLYLIKYLEDGYKKLTTTNN